MTVVTHTLSVINPMVSKSTYSIFKNDHDLPHYVFKKKIFSLFLGWLNSNQKHTSTDKKDLETFTISANVATNDKKKLLIKKVLRHSKKKDKDPLTNKIVN